MDELGVRRLLQVLGVESSAIEDQGRGWLNCPCPMAAWRHGGGEDQRPSFGISIDPEKPSAYYCFGCMGKPAGLWRLLNDFFVGTGEYPREAAVLYSLHEVHSAGQRRKPPPSWAPVEEEEKPVPVNPIPAQALERFPVMQGSADAEAARVREWIEKERLIPVWTQNMFRLRYDPQRQSVVFPMTDYSGRIFVLRERRRQTKHIWTVTPKIAGCPDLEFPRIKNTGVWFGLHLVNWEDPVMLVEGEFDAMRIAALGFMNVIASATSSVADAQIDRLEGDNYILGYDDDKSGEHAVRRIKDRIGGKAELSLARWGRVGCEDGGDLKYEEQLSDILGSLEKA